MLKSKKPGLKSYPWRLYYRAERAHLPPATRCRCLCFITSARISVQLVSAAPAPARSWASLRPSLCHVVSTFCSLLHDKRNVTSYSAHIHWSISANTWIWWPLFKLAVSMVNYYITELLALFRNSGPNILNLSRIFIVVCGAVSYILHIKSYLHLFGSWTKTF